MRFNHVTTHLIPPYLLFFMAYWTFVMTKQILWFLQNKGIYFLFHLFLQLYMEFQSNVYFF